MISVRSTHYWLWFLLFGLVAGFANMQQNRGFTSEAIVVSITGLLGLLTGMPSLARFSRMYDLVIGLIFAALGLIGIVTTFPFANGLGLSASGSILGLSLVTPYPLIHTVLGLTSLNHSFKATPTATTVAVATPREATAA